MKLSGKLSLKFLLAGTVLSMVAGTFLAQWLSRSSVRSSELPPASVQEIIDANALESDSDAEHEAIMLTDSPLNDISAQESTAALTTDTELKVLTILEEIHLGFKQQNDALLYFDDRLQPMAEMVPMLESIAAIQSSTTDRLEERMMNLEESITQLNSTLHESDATQQTKEQVPPFRLIAIDRWNNEWNAVIELDGKFAMIGLHSFRAGWQLLEIDPRERTALFQADSGHTVLVRVSG